GILRFVFFPARYLSGPCLSESRRDKIKIFKSRWINFHILPPTNFDALGHWLTACLYHCDNFR
ncbi:hypothetical protein L9F63_023284, partial [Diploptera punctata]